MNKETEAKVLDILVELCDEEIVREDTDINLRDEGLMDSLDFVALLLKLEERLNIVISPSEYQVGEIDTPAKIIGVVEEKMEKRNKR